MDFNAGEIVILLVFGIIIFGPEKLPELARKAARVLNYVRRIANDARGQLRQELGDQFGDLKLADLNPRNFVAKHVLGPEVTDQFNEVTSEVRSGISDGVDSKPVNAGGPAEISAGTPTATKPTPFDPEAT